MKCAMEGIVAEMIDYIGDDHEREGVVETPERVVRSWAELFGGYNENPKEHLKKTFAVENDSMVVVRDIDFFSFCEHHMLPFYGTVDVAYIPVDRVVGLSKIARLVNGYARRLQIQERMTSEILEAIDEVLMPHGVAVRVRAKHLCMLARGIKTRASVMVTTQLSGNFKSNPDVKTEWLAALR